MADIDYPASWPASWYAATRDATPDRPALNGRVAADVAIVGGGYAGLHTARLLAMRGMTVVLTEPTSNSPRASVTSWASGDALTIASAPAMPRATR